MGSLALATEPPSESLLKRLPYTRDEYMITPIMWRSIIGHSIYEIIILMLIMVNILDIHREDDEDNGKTSILANNTYVTTVLFNCFVFLTLFNEINARKLKKSELNVFIGFFNNFLFLGVIIATGLL